MSDIVYFISFLFCVAASSSVVCVFSVSFLLQHALRGMRLKTVTRANTFYRSLTATRFMRSAPWEVAVKVEIRDARSAQARFQWVVFRYECNNGHIRRIQKKNLEESGKRYLWGLEMLAIKWLSDECAMRVYITLGEAWQDNRWTQGWKEGRGWGGWHIQQCNDLV